VRFAQRGYDQHLRRPRRGRTQHRLDVWARRVFCLVEDVDAGLSNLVVTSMQSNAKLRLKYPSPIIVSVL